MTQPEAQREPNLAPCIPPDLYAFAKEIVIQVRASDMLRDGTKTAAQEGPKHGDLLIEQAWHRCEREGLLPSAYASLRGAARETNALVGSLRAALTALLNAAQEYAAATESSTWSGTRYEKGLDRLVEAEQAAREALAETRKCGGAYSLGPNIVVWCDRGDHQNLSYHEGPLELGSPWRVRWNPIGAQENGVRLIEAGA